MLERISIPVILDDIKYQESFRMARCTYFSLETDIPIRVWSILGPGRGIAWPNTAFSAVVFRSLHGENFNSAQDIDEMFDALEDTFFFIDTYDVWIPIHLFPAAAGKPPVRGQVYRINNELFLEAFYYRNAFTSMDGFEVNVIRFTNDKESVVFSKAETEAFAEWERRIVGQARERSSDHR